MARARHASLTQTELQMILFGQSFTGKSTMAMQLAYFKKPDGKPFRILYLDAESGSIDNYVEELENNGVALDNIYIVYTQSLGEVRQYIAKVRNNEDFYELDEEGNETSEVVLDADGEPFRADAIVVDGASILHLTTTQGLREFSKKRSRVRADRDQLIGDARLVKIEGADLEWKDRDTLNSKGQDLIFDLQGAGVHYIVTAREADEKVTIKKEDGTTASVCTGKKIPGGFKSLDYDADTVLHMYRDKDGTVCAKVVKDRTHVHTGGEVVEDPSLLDWQALIAKNAKRQKFTLKNDLSKAIETEQDIYAKEVLTKAGVTDSVADTASNASELDSLRAQIVSTRNALTPVKKSEAKKALEEKGLPLKYREVTDAAVLNEVLTLLKNI